MNNVKPLKVKLWTAKPSKFKVDNKLKSGQASGMDRINRLLPDDRGSQAKNIDSGKNWTGQTN